MLMNVLAVTHGSWFGGAQISTLEFLELLRGRVEFKVLICDSAKGDFLSYAGSLGINIYKVPCDVVMWYPVKALIGDARKLIEWADVVWITDEEYPLAPHIKKVRRIPIVAHLHSHALICSWWGALYRFREVCLVGCSPWRIIRCKQGKNVEYSRLGIISPARAGLYWLLNFAKGPLDYSRWRWLMRDVLDSIDGYIAVSNALRDIHVKHVPELAEKLAVIYYSVTEPSKYVKPNPAEPYGDYILYASGSNPVKGSHILLDVWHEVSKEYKDLKLYMAWCKNSWVEKYAEKRGLKNVVFTDKLPLRDLYSLMYKARAAVMPSIWSEPFGRIPVEANRLGVPAVVSSSGGLPETIVDGVTGRIFRSGDVDDLKEKITEILERKFDRSTIIRYSYEKINPERNVEKLLRFFEEVVDRERAHAHY